MSKPWADDPAASMPLLSAGDPAPTYAENRGAHSPFLVVSDHAGRAIPRRLGRLGLTNAELDQHIAWDIGAAELALRLARDLGACAILQAFSRLVIDCNRAPGHVQSIMAVSDGVPIPGNLGLTAADAEARRVAIHAPYHSCIAEEIEARARSGLPTLLICIHSFTPIWQGAARPWHVGVLHGEPSPVSRALLDLLREEGDLVVGDNQPYVMDGTD